MPRGTFFKIIFCTQRPFSNYFMWPMVLTALLQVAFPGADPETRIFMREGGGISNDI